VTPSRVGTVASCAAPLYAHFSHAEIHNSCPPLTTFVTGVEDKIPEYISAHMFRVIGIALLKENERAWQELGIYTLECAAELGDETAALHVCAIENHRKSKSSQASTTANRILAELIDQGNWEALAIRVGQLKQHANRPARLNEGFKLAEKLVDMTEADPTRKNMGPETVQCEPPWRLLRDFARLKGDTAAELRAVTLGATHYNDPEAAERLAESVDIDLYSDRWLELTTQAAMNGKSTACWNLGKYWLEKKGWYPCGNRSVSLALGSTIGFDWFEIAAASREPFEAARVYLSIALVCRENNFPEVGLGYLESAIDTIESGDGDPENKVAAVGKLQTMINDWSYEPLFRAPEAKAAYFLKAPRMPPA